jgi:hypothetical protein
MPPVKLSAILDFFEMQCDGMYPYLDKQAGDVFMLTDEDFDAAQDGDDPTEHPDWQQESIEKARAVLADEDGDADRRFLQLPGRDEFNERDMMRDFAQGQENKGHAEILCTTIRSRRAFRNFNDRLRELDILDAWNQFRDAQYRPIVPDWCTQTASTSIQTRDANDEPF